MQTFSLTSFLAGLFAGVLLLGAWVFSPSLPAKVPPPVDDSLEGTPGGAVSVGDQPAGTSVVVESVTVAPPGVWVAVREMIGREPGNVLGALRVSGPTSSAEVPLLRATEPGRLYAVELYRNDNNGEYDPNKNSVYVDFDTGKRVVEYFTTTR